MSIKYRAVHKRSPWRKVGIHKTLHNAIEGKDGAKNLLRRIGRIGKKWDDYGDVLAVFVWEVGSESGQIFRLKPGIDNIIESIVVPTHVLEVQDAKDEHTVGDIEKYFRSSSEHESQVEQDFIDVVYPDDLPGEIHAYTEGVARQVTVNAYERNPKARAECLEHYGLKCQVCFVDFGSKFGELGRGFIHVHHCTPIASIGTEYRVDPKTDLVPVCPNCHAMLHRRVPPLSIDELKSHLR